MTFSIEIGHIKRDTNLPEATSVYIGRGMPGLAASALGNPFKISNRMSREDVIREYRKWLWQKIQERGPEYEELERLLKLARERGGKCLVLTCWCRGVDQTAPACHGDVIAAALQWMDVQNFSGVMENQ